MGAVCREVLHDEIIFSDQMVVVASPVGKGAAEERGRLADALRSVRGIWQRWVMIDEFWIEIPVDGREITVGEQGGDELFDDLLVRMCAVHSAMVGPLPTASPSLQSGISLRRDAEEDVDCGRKPCGRAARR
jgi:hypothetical protein